MGYHCSEAPLTEGFVDTATTFQIVGEPFTSADNGGLKLAGLDPAGKGTLTEAWRCAHIRGGRKPGSRQAP